MAVTVLFIGGTGKISSACVRLAVESGFEVAVLNRGHTATRPLPAGVESLTGDMRDPDSVRAAVGGRRFDVVADFIGFTPEHVSAAIDVFRGRAGQYVYISSASAYQKPIAHLPITESTPLANPFWQYSRDKIACEALLNAAYRDSEFPVTLVRPSSTYDRTSLPWLGGWTTIDRMRRGKPVVVHGDGTSLWVLTHHTDFAAAFVPLLGNPRAIGDTFHITSDEVQTWDQIFRTLGEAAGVEPKLVHIASERIAAAVPEWGPGLLGDATHSVIFDNAKVRRLAPGWVATVPFTRGAREILAWHDADPSRRPIDADADAACDALVEAYGAH
ncbi:SDR family oxidoreductase [Pseudonocardia sp. MH-G8]|uniref:SDR family oxidoreductase n=1 Tax=Pseudonocardia sp. MH-G8 TaxID=1854588 RepID=UPI000BA04A10|nr:SDR family oxidoreductase [Pseudonocardia sp. MH-G8]OZM77954.1 NAD-dependent dehydratase [Pseudonocardia sp. MH-G8]